MPLLLWPVICCSSASAEPSSLASTCVESELAVFVCELRFWLRYAFSAAFWSELESVLDSERFSEPDVEFCDTIAPFRIASRPWRVPPLPVEGMRLPRIPVLDALGVAELPFAEPERVALWCDALWCAEPWCDEPWCDEVLWLGVALWAYALSRLCSSSFDMLPWLDAPWCEAPRFDEAWLEAPWPSAPLRPEPWSSEASLEEPWFDAPWFDDTWPDEPCCTLAWRPVDPRPAKPWAVPVDCAAGSGYEYAWPL